LCFKNGSLLLFIDISIGQIARSEIKANLNYSNIYDKKCVNVCLADAVQFVGRCPNALFNAGIFIDLLTYRNIAGLFILFVKIKS
jgi:hypothetical protein